MVHRQQKVSHWTRPPNTPTYRNMWKFSTTWKNHTMQGGMRNVQISTEKGGAKGNEVEVERSYLWTKHTPNTTTFLQSIDFWPRNSSWGAKLSAWWQNVWVLFGYLFKLDAYTWLMCVVERKSNNKHHKDMCLKEIRLYLQFFIDPCHNRYWTQFGRNVCV